MSTRKEHVSTFFISEDLYRDLPDGKIETLGDVVNGIEMCRDEKNKIFSKYANNFLEELNGIMGRILYDYNYHEYSPGIKKDVEFFLTTEYEGVQLYPVDEVHVKNRARNIHDNSIPEEKVPEIKQYYEIVHVTTSVRNDLLIVLKAGFLKCLLADRNNLLTYLKDCMLHTFSKGNYSNTQLNELYIRLRMDMNSFRAMVAISPKLS